MTNANPQELQSSRLIHMANNPSLHRKLHSTEVVDIDNNGVAIEKFYCGFYAVNKKHCVVNGHCAVCKEVV